MHVSLYNLKEALVKAPALRLPNPTQPFILYTASQDRSALLAFSTQKGSFQAVAYLSKLLNTVHGCPRVSVMSPLLLCLLGSESIGVKLWAAFWTNHDNYGYLNITHNSAHSAWYPFTPHFAILHPQSFPLRPKSHTGIPNLCRQY